MLNEWWVGLSLGSQVLMWIIFSAIGIAVWVFLGRKSIDFLNNQMQTFDEETNRYSYKDAGFLISGLTVSVYAFMDIIGIPPWITGSLTISTVGVGLLFVAPFFKDTYIRDSMKVKERTFHWKQDDYIIVKHRYSQAEGRYQGNNLSDVILVDFDGGTVQVNLRTFLESTVVNRNVRDALKNPKGIQREHIPFHLPTNVNREKARQIIEDRLKYLPYAVSPERLGLHVLETVGMGYITMDAVYWVLNEHQARKNKEFLYRAVLDSFAANEVRLYDTQRVDMVSHAPVTETKRAANLPELNTKIEHVSMDELMGRKRSDPEPVESVKPLEIEDETPDEESPPVEPLPADDKPASEGTPAGA